MGGQPPFSFSISTPSLSNGGGATTLRSAKPNYESRMTSEEIESLLKSYYRRCIPPDHRYPVDDCERIEHFFHCILPAEFRSFRALLPHYCVEGDHMPPDEIEVTYQLECEDNPNFTKDHLPFYCVGNGDHICLSISSCPNSPVLYVAHDDPQIHILAPSFERFLLNKDWFFRE